MLLIESQDQMGFLIREIVALVVETVTEGAQAVTSIYVEASNPLLCRGYPAITKLPVVQQEAFE